MKKQITCQILFPPQWLPLNPHLSICTLAGYLRGKGRKVLLEDLNVQFYRFILTADYLRYALRRSLGAYEHMSHTLFLRGLTPGRAGAEHEREAAWFLRIEALLKDRVEHWQGVIEGIEEAVSVFDDPEKFYDPLQLVRAFTVVDHALELASLPFFPARIELASFTAPHCPFTVDSLIAFTADRKRNPFISFYTRHIRNVVRRRPELTAISVNSSSQVIGGLTLARMLKEELGEGTHVSIGGSHFPRVKDVFMDRPDFFETFADSLMLFEGEEPLEGLIRAVQGEAPIDEAPRLIHFDRARRTVHATSDRKPLGLDETGIQDLEGLPLDKYFSPHLVVSTRSSKGCYWRKCTFCDAGWGMEPSTRSIDNLLEEVRSLGSRFGVRAFELIDEAIFPEHMERFAQRAIDEKLDIAWFCNGRTEESFTAERLALFAKAGLRMILWGVESGSARIMALINKGVDFARRLDVLRDAHRAGIWNFAFIFFGFPGETREDAMKTIELLVENREFIQSYGKSVFTLGKHASILQRAKELGLLDEVRDTQELGADLDFVESAGMRRDEVLEVAELCRDLYFCATGAPLWMYLRNREILLLYLAHHGKEFVERFRFTEEQVRSLSSPALSIGGDAAPPDSP